MPRIPETFKRSTFCFAFLAVGYCQAQTTIAIPHKRQPATTAKQTSTAVAANTAEEAKTSATATKAALETAVQVDPNLRDSLSTALQSAAATAMAANDSAASTADLASKAAAEKTLAVATKTALDAAVKANPSLAAPLAPAQKSATATVAAATNAAEAANAPADSTATATPGCLFLPVKRRCMQSTGATEFDNINKFWSTDGQYSFLTQVKSIYNAASGSAIVSADLASMNFLNGMQVTVGTNALAGSSTAATPAAAANSGTAPPTLSATAASQATQNMLYGGTFFAAAKYPLFATGVANLSHAGDFGTIIDFVGKGGVDLQNFKSGTNVNVTSPPVHANLQLEGYLQYNAINPPADPSTTTSEFSGSLFLGASYGYSYTSHGYATNYGFAGVSNAMGQISAGIMINGSARIAISRAFGPSQTYIDSTSMAKTTIDNFKSWSIGITYQSASASDKK